MPAFEKEFFAEISAKGKLITVSMFENRLDCDGHIYYSRVDGIQSKQKKRIRDWCANKPQIIQIAVLNFLERRKIA